MPDSSSRSDPSEGSSGEGRRDVTRLLAAWQEGDQEALERLLPLIDAQLRGLARAALSRELPGHTLQTTALINEAYLRLVGRDRSWEGTAHFLDAAARAMRRVLVDYARRRRSLKRGGEHHRIALDTLEPLIAAAEGREAAELIDLDEALTRLFALHERPARAVELHYFGGLSYPEVAEVLEVSTATVHRDLRFARAWLFSELSDEDTHEG